MHDSTLCETQNPKAHMSDRHESAAHELLLNRLFPLEPDELSGDRNCESKGS